MIDPVGLWFAVSNQSAGKSRCPTMDGSSIRDLKKNCFRWCLTDNNLITQTVSNRFMLLSSRKAMEFYTLNLEPHNVWYSTSSNFWIVKARRIQWIHSWVNTKLSNLTGQDLKLCKSLEQRDNWGQWLQVLPRHSQHLLLPCYLHLYCML